MTKLLCTALCSRSRRRISLKTAYTMSQPTRQQLDGGTEMLKIHRNNEKKKEREKSESSPLALRLRVLALEFCNPSLIMRLSCMIFGCCCCWRWREGSTAFVLGASHMSYSFMYGHDFGALIVTRQCSVTVNIMHMNESLLSFTNIILSTRISFHCASLHYFCHPLKHSRSLRGKTQSYHEHSLKLICSCLLSSQGVAWFLRTLIVFSLFSLLSYSKTLLSTSWLALYLNIFTPFNILATSERARAAACVNIDSTN